MMKLLFDSTFLFRDTLEIAKQCASMSHNRLSFTQVHDGDFKSSSYVSQWLPEVVAGYIMLAAVWMELESFEKH